MQKAKRAWYGVEGDSQPWPDGRTRNPEVACPFFSSNVETPIFSQAEYQQNSEAHTPFMESLANEAVAL